MTLTTDSSSSLQWKFSQAFGERAPGEDVQDSKGFCFSFSLYMNDYSGCCYLEYSVWLLRNGRKRKLKNIENLNLVSFIIQNCREFTPLIK